MTFQIVCKNAEEAVQRINALGEAVAFVDWTTNRITINPEFFRSSAAKLPRAGSFKRIDDSIRRVRKLRGVGLEAT